MAVEPSVKDGVAPSAQQPPASDKDVNFANLRKQAEEARYVASQAQLENQRLQQELESLKRQVSRPVEEEDDETSEPYIDKKALKRELNRFKANLDQEVESRVARRLEEAQSRDFVYRLKAEYKDFDDILTPENASKLEQVDPDFAKEILAERDEYRKRKLAYHAIKAAGIHRKVEPPREMTAEEKIEANKRNPYYRPSASGQGTPSAPAVHSLGGQRYSEADRKAAWERLKGMSKSAVSGP